MRHLPTTLDSESWRQKLIQKCWELLRIHLCSSGQMDGLVGSTGNVNMQHVYIMGVSENSVPHCTQWFCWSLSHIIPFLNGYFIGNINPTFSDKPTCFSCSEFVAVCLTLRHRRRRCRFPGGCLSWSECGRTVRWLRSGLIWITWGLKMLG